MALRRLHLAELHSLSDKNYEAGKSSVGGRAIDYWSITTTLRYGRLRTPLSHLLQLSLITSRICAKGQAAVGRALEDTESSRTGVYASYR